ALATHMYHAAVAGGLDWRAGGCSVVNTLVRANLVQHRMATTGVEAGADTGKLHRRADEGLAHTGAVSPVIAGVTVAVGVADRSIGLASVGKARRENVAGAHALTIQMFLFVEHFEMVALANFPGKIHVITEHIGHLHGQTVRPSR